MAANMHVGRLANCLFINFTNSVKFGQRINAVLRVSHSNFSTEKEPRNNQSTSNIENASSSKVEKINKAMKAYLERAQSHNAFMQEEVAEFEIGKRHLAHMMGADPDLFTQEDVDKAIEYLLPSGLFDKKARPKLKHPDEILPKRKAAQFGIDGRPFDFLFYTGTPNFNNLLHKLALKLEDLKKYEDDQFAKGKIPEASDQLMFAGSQWLDKKIFEDRFQEQLSDREYKNLITLLEHVAKQPYSNKEKDFLFTFRYFLQKQSTVEEIPPLLYDDSGRAYQEATGARKNAKSTVKLYEHGTGLMSVNGKDLLGYFPRLADREQIVFPLHLTEMLNTLDFVATVTNGGPSGQAGAIRLALSKALRSFVNKDMVEKMRLAGLLTLDPRTLERQKPGQQGARRKYTWKKR